MKKIILFTIVSFLVTVCSQAQDTAAWVRDITAAPDTALVFPVRTLNDDSNHVFVLSTYQKTLSPGQYEYKIYLKKYSNTGALIWSLIYDHGGSGNPRGMDMVLDPNGNCYIAGGLMILPYDKPFLLKVNSSGGPVWERDSTAAFNDSFYEQIFIHGNYLHLRASRGIVRFNLNGTEQWSKSLATGRIAVDHYGQTISSIYLGNPTSIVRYDSTGYMNFSDSTIDARRIAVDRHNNFYLLQDKFPRYDLVKYDSSGNFAWTLTDFTSSAGFGDVGFDVLTDIYDDVILVGLNDSIHKVTSSGIHLWAKSMHGLDSYLVTAKMVFGNYLAIAGSVPDATGYNLAVATFNQRGDENWSGLHNANPLSQEFTVDFDADNSGIYVIENNNDNTRLAKFDAPFFRAIDYSLLCVDSVWYDPVNPAFVHVRMFNGNLSHLNYPCVSIISPVGDTISNVHHFVNFFAHIGNWYQVYQDSITVSGITDFSNYTFVASEGFADTLVAVGWCTPFSITSVVEPGSEVEIKVYPNPVRDELTIDYADAEKNCVLLVFNSVGALVREQKLFPGLNRISVAGFADGIYFARVSDDKNLAHFRFVKN